MSFVLFFRGMLAVLLVFAATTYFVSDSAWTALWQTAVCAVLLQVGYFVGVLFMIWRSDRQTARAASKNNEIGLLAKGGDAATEDRRELPRAPFTH